MEPDHQTAVDDERWAQAQSVLDQRPSEEARRRLRRHRLVTLSTVVGLLLVGVAVAVLLVAFVLGSDGGERAEPPRWQEVSGLGLLVAAVVLEVVGLVVMARAGVWKGRWDMPASVLTRTQRRLLLAQVRGRVPADPARLPLARDLAERLRLQLGTVFIWVGIVVLQIGQAVLEPSTRRLIAVGVLVALYAVALGLMMRDARRASRFLDSHPEPVAAG